MDFSKESYDATYTKVADGVWVVSETHRPHHKDSMPELNNRGFIFEVTAATNNGGDGDDDLTKPHLLMSGIPGSKLVTNVKQLEHDTKLQLKVIVTSGDFHHLAMKGWLDSFPNAKFVHSNLKFPTTRNGKDILSNETYKNRITLEDGFTLQSLHEKYKHVLQFYGFNQFKVYPDVDGMAASEDDKDDKNKRKESFFKYMNKIPPCTQPMLAVWLYHVPTKQLLIEHNFNPYLAKEQLAKAHVLMRMMIKPYTFGSAALEMMPQGPKEKESCKIHCEQMDEILQLDVRAISDYHTYPGEQAQIRTYASKEDYVKDFTTILSKTGEHDKTGETMFKLANKKSLCVIL